MTQPLKHNLEVAIGGIFKSFANFTGKHLCWSLFLIELQTFKPGTLLKRESYTGVFL